MFWKKKKLLSFPPTPPIPQQSKIFKTSYYSGLDISMLNLNIVKKIILEFPTIGEEGYHLNNFFYDLEFFIRDNNTGNAGVFQLNRKTLAIIRNLKDRSGAYIWRAGNLGAGIPSTIFDYKYEIHGNIPDNQVIYEYYSKIRTTEVF